MTERRPRPAAPGPLESCVARVGPVLGTLAQRPGFREYLQGLLLPHDFNKTLIAVAGSEPTMRESHAGRAGGY